MLSLMKNELPKIKSVTELHSQTLAAARAEKAATFYLLECLHKIDSAKAYFELGYSSLYDYIHRALKYSEAQSYERMAAMRLAFRVPAIAEKLRDGELTLTSVAKISGHAKREKLGVLEITNLAEKAAGKSVQVVERMLAAEAKVEMPARESLKPVSANATELRITVDQEFEKLLKTARELEMDPTLSIAQVLRQALKTHIEKRRKAKGATKITVTGVTKVSASKDAAFARVAKYAAPTPKQLNSRYIPIPTRQKIWQRSNGQCEYQSATTNIKCTSRQALQIDHRQPLALGGPTTFQNLRHLCADHNRHEAAKLFGKTV